MALRTLDAPRDLLSRILQTPDLQRVVQGLEPAPHDDLLQDGWLKALDDTREVGGLQDPRDEIARGVERPKGHGQDLLGTLARYECR